MLWFLFIVENFSEHICLFDLFPTRIKIFVFACKDAEIGRINRPLLSVFPFRWWIWCKKLNLLEYIYWIIHHWRIWKYVCMAIQYISNSSLVWTDQNFCKLKRRYFVQSLWEKYHKIYRVILNFLFSSFDNRFLANYWQVSQLLDK